MASAGEVDKLKKEIEFLTNLINKAQSGKGNSVGHGRQPILAQRASSSRKWTNTSHPTNRSSTTEHEVATSSVNIRNKYKLQRISRTPPDVPVIKKTNVAVEQLKYKTKISEKCPVGTLSTKNPTQVHNKDKRGDNSQNVSRTVLLPRPSFRSQNAGSRTVVVPDANLLETIRNDNRLVRPVAVGKPVVIQNPTARDKQSNDPKSGMRTVLPISANALQKNTIGLNSKAGVKCNMLGSQVQPKELVKKQKPTIGMKTDTSQHKLPVTANNANSAKVNERSSTQTSNKFSTSPSIIEAGKKIIEEIEKLNQTMARIEKSTEEGKVNSSCSHSHVDKPAFQRKVSYERRVCQTLLPQSSCPPPSKCNQSVKLVDAYKKTRYSLVKKPTKETPNSAMPSTSMSFCNRRNPFGAKTPDQIQPSKLQHRGAVFSNKRGKFSGKFVYSGGHVPNIRRAVKSPTWAPRRRVYLTRNKLRNSPSRSSKYKLVKNVSQNSGSPLVAGKCPLKNKDEELSVKGTKHKIEPKHKQSAVVRELLQELSFIDVALKTAKLQSSQKLVRKAVLTKQKMMQRKGNDNKGPNALASQPKWKTPSRRRMRSLSRTSPAGPNKTRKSPGSKSGDNAWRSRFSLKKSNSEGDMSINQLMGRRIQNLSSNKYKFVSASTAARKASSPRKSTHRSPYTRNAVSKLKNQKSPAGQRSGKMVRIGGIVYKSSRSKLRRTSLSPFGLNKKASFTATRRNSRTLLVRGTKFKVTGNGRAIKRIRRLSRDPAKGRRNVNFGGACYTQARSWALQKNNHAASWITASRSISRSIATAVTAARMKKVNKKKQYCMFYNRFGKCNRGGKCPFIHDPDKIAVCTRYLRGTCKVINCPFSHKVAPEKMPVCTHYLKGVCSRDRCPYLHVNVSRDAEVCQDFIKGYCPLGEKCKKRHTHICPDHNGEGSCPRGKACILQHPKTGAKRPGNSATGLAQVKPRSKRPRLITGAESEDLEDDLNLPLSKRHLPSFILLDTSCSEEMSSQRRRSHSVDEPLQIHPNLSFDGIGGLL